MLVALDHPVADALRSADAFHADTVLLDTRNTEVGWLAAQGHDQMIVGHLLLVTRGRPNEIYDPFLEVYGLDVRPPETGPILHQAPSEGLGDVRGIHVAADNPGQHRPEREVVLFGDDHDPNVVAVPGHLAEFLGRRVASESPSQDEHFVGELSVWRPLPRLVSVPGLYHPPQPLYGERDTTYGESPLEQLIHRYLP